MNWAVFLIVFVLTFVFMVVANAPFIDGRK